MILFQSGAGTMISDLNFLIMFIFLWERYLKLLIIVF